VFSPIVTDFIASSSVSSFIQEDGHLLLSSFILQSTMLMLRLVVHGTAQYGYDYDAIIN
jgi:hypothetical protein